MTLAPLVSGRFRLRDIAARCEVSVSTASRALAGQKGVREDLRQRIVEAARALDYPLAPTLRGGRIVVAASRAAMTDYGRTQFTWHVLDGLKARAAERGLSVEVLPLSESGAPAEFVAASGLDEASGVLLLTVDDPGILAAAAASGKPTVLVNGDDPLMRVSSVSPCNRSAAALAANHLIELGHRDIAFVMRPGRITIRRRYEGWRDALAAHGLAAPETRALSVSDWLPAEAERVVGAHLDSGALDGVTAILCAADSAALGVLSALKAHGIACPEAMSVVGMDNLPIAELLQPGLTTMHIPARELGVTAIDMLLALSADGRAAPRRVELACSLMVRGTAGPAPRTGS